VVAKDPLVVFAREPGVAHLHVGQEPLLGDEQQSFAVGFDPAALQNDRLAVVGAQRRYAWKAGQPGDRLADALVASVVVVLRPRVEAPVAQRSAPAPPW